MRKYELLVLLRPKLEKDELSKLVKEIEKKLGGKVIKKEDWGIKKLSYQIKKENEAYYLLYYVETDSEKIDLYKKFSLLNKNIIREMILVHHKEWPFNQKTSKDIIIPVRKTHYYQKRERYDRG